MTARRTCRCGCGLQASPRSSYAADHYRRLCRARRRLARVARFASERGVAFDLTASDLLALMRPYATDAPWRIVRLDRARGFVVGNVRLVGGPAHDRSLGLRVELLIGRALRRQGYEADAVSVRSLLERYAARGGTCELTGRTLHIDAKSTDPDALSIRVVGSEPRALIVVRSVAELLDRFGVDYVEDLLRGLRGKAMSATPRGSPRPSRNA